MVERMRRFLRVLFFAHLVIGLVAVVALSFVVDPLVIGLGRFDGLVSSIESYDFRWWVVALALWLWLIPVFIVLAYRSARMAGVEVDRLTQALRPLLENRAIPIKVDLDRRIPVQFDEPLRVPVELETKIDLEGEVEVNTEIPVHTEIPIEAEVQTKVLGIGLLKIPIRARVPVDLVIPVKRSIQIKASGLPINLKEVAVVALPAIEVPIKARIETKLDLVSNLETAHDLFRKAIADHVS